MPATRLVALTRQHTRGFRRAIRTAGIVALILILGPGAALAGSGGGRMTWVLPSDGVKAEFVTDTVPGSNTIVDLVRANGGNSVWAATGRGASHFSFGRNNWRLYSSSDGLGSDEVPALQVLGDEVWVANSHSQVFQRQSIPTGDGIYKSLNEGQTWVDISPGNGQASSPFMLCYDFAPFRSGVLGACFAGGLILSADGGQSWKNVFASPLDQADFESRTFVRLSNRYFSLAVDPMVPESLAVYAGSAEGIAKFVHLDSALKVTGVDFRAVWNDGSRILAGSEGGISRTLTRGSTWRSFYRKNGLPTNNVSAIHAVGGAIMIGVDSIPGVVGAGLAFSSDSGATWTGRAPVQALGSQRGVRRIIHAAGAWWAACRGGGLIRSTDNGVSWSSVSPDSAHAEDLRNNPLPLLATNRVNALAALADGDSTTLWAGTDAGVIIYRIAGDSLPARADIVPIDPGGAMTTRVAGVFYHDSPTDGDVIWALCVPGGSVTSGNPGHAVSLDGGYSWRVANSILSFESAEFFNNQFYLAGASGLRQGVYPDIDAASMSTISGFQTLVTNNRIGTILRDLILETVIIDGVPSVSGMWVASDSGLALSLDAGVTWGVVFSNPDPYEFDLISRTIYRGRDTSDTEKFVSISGNFVTALGFQTVAGKRVIWAGTQTTAAGHRNGISRTENGGLTWTVPVIGHRAWNFDFDGANVWVATSEGLLHSSDGGTAWDTLKHFVDPSSGAFIDSQTEIFSVRVVGGEVWVGTEDGLAVLDKNNPETVLRVRRSFQSIGSQPVSGEGGAYATPVPFSPDFHPNGLRFHYKPPVDGPVTITIWDFSNRVVKVIADGAQRSAGVEYHESDIWDGRNGKGDFVAVGSYFFTVEYANGNVHWGKLAVIP